MEELARRGLSITDYRSMQDARSFWRVFPRRDELSLSSILNDAANFSGSSMDGWNGRGGEVEAAKEPRICSKTLSFSREARNPNLFKALSN